MPEKYSKSKLRSRGCCCTKSFDGEFGPSLLFSGNSRIVFFRPMPAVYEEEFGEMHKHEHIQRCHIRIGWWQCESSSYDADSPLWGHASHVEWRFSWSTRQYGKRPSQAMTNGRRRCQNTQWEPTDRIPSIISDHIPRRHRIHIPQITLLFIHWRNTSNISW